MRSTLLLLAAALCPLLGLAQAPLTATSYELADGTKGKGELTYEVGYRSKLTVKGDDDSKKSNKGHSIDPAQVRSFDVGPDHYVRLSSMKLDSGMPMTMSMTKKDDFAKVVTPGKLELLEYTVVYGTSTRSSTSASGRDFQSNSMQVYLLRRAGEDNAVMIPTYGKKYRQMMLPYFADRPDLLPRITATPPMEAELRSILLAYNTPK